MTRLYSPCWQQNTSLRKQACLDSTNCVTASAEVGSKHTKCEATSTEQTSPESYQFGLLSWDAVEPGCAHDTPHSVRVAPRFVSSGPVRHPPSRSPRLASVPVPDRLRRRRASAPLDGVPTDGLEHPPKSGGRERWGPRARAKREREREREIEREIERERKGERGGRCCPALADKAIGGRGGPPPLRRGASLPRCRPQGARAGRGDGRGCRRPGSWGTTRGSRLRRPVVKTLRPDTARARRARACGLSESSGQNATLFKRSSWETTYAWTRARSSMSAGWLRVGFEMWSAHERSARLHRPDGATKPTPHSSPQLSRPTPHHNSRVPLLMLLIKAHNVGTAGNSAS